MKKRGDCRSKLVTYAALISLILILIPITSCRGSVEECAGFVEIDGKKYCEDQFAAEEIVDPEKADRLFSEAMKDITLCDYFDGEIRINCRDNYYLKRGEEGNLEACGNIRNEEIREICLTQ